MFDPNTPVNNDHPGIHTGLLLTTVFTSALAHFTKSELATDLTIILGACGILNYFITWGGKFYSFMNKKKHKDTEKDSD